MPQKSISEPIFISSRNRWKVEIPASLSDTGTRVRAFFETRKAARAYIENISGTNAGDPSATISPKLAMEADKARQILEPLDMDLVQASRIIHQALSTLEGTTGTIQGACEAYAESHARLTASVPFGQAVAEYMDKRTDLRESTLSSYRYTLERTFSPLDEKILSQISTSDFENILKDKGSSAHRMHLRNLGAFWRWAVKNPRRWALTDIVDSLEAPRVSVDADINILKGNEVEDLMRSAETTGKAAAAAFAIAIFAGVRMAELERLTWKNVGSKEIEIGASIAKKHLRRLIPINPTLKSWLDACRSDSKDGDLIVPSNWKEVSKAVRRRAGWDVSARTLKNPPEPTKGTWPANSPRHTCASVLVAMGTPLESLIFQFGHSGGYDLLRRHYVSRLSQEDAEMILGISPR